MDWTAHLPLNDLLAYRTADETASEHNIVHLTDRPTQLYYQDDGRQNYSQYAYQYGGQVCRTRVPIQNVYKTLNEYDSPFVNVYFICSGWCCGIDCCQMNFAFIFAITCVCLVVFGVCVHFLLRALAKSTRARRVLKLLHLRRRKRVIRRENAQRKRRSSKFESYNPPKRPKIAVVGTKSRGRTTEVSTELSSFSSWTMLSPGMYERKITLDRITEEDDSPSTSRQFLEDEFTD
ncbi:hypothetical protein AAVH_12582 [Aphelenchoides avenae]|nr:hypothetical protein AAVH_12582 [Aphelenchus avenae]